MLYPACSPEVEAPFLLLFIESGPGLSPAGFSSPWYTWGLCYCSTPTSGALVLTGSPGPPAPMESRLGISEKAQGYPTGTTNKPVPSLWLLCFIPTEVPSSGVPIATQFSVGAWRHMLAPLHIASIPGCPVWAASAPVFLTMSTTKLSELLPERLVSSGQSYECQFLVWVNFDTGCAWHTHT